MIITDNVELTGIQLGFLLSNPRLLEQLDNLIFSLIKKYNIIVVFFSEF